ncbi:hypothetical protein Tco_0581233 [Tanacetum coccineum]
MTSITAQQTKLDIELVPKENQFDIGKCNGRIPHGFSPREPTFQVVLDALALTPCYPAFLITADVPEVYMHQFWNCIYKHDDFYRFKINKKKRFRLTLEVFREILQICPRMHQPWRTFAALINRSLSGKTTGLDKLRLSRAQILWGMYHKKNVDYVALLWEDFTYQIDNKEFKKQEKIPEMRESKAYKTYIGYAIGEVPPKVARKFKKASPSKKDSVPVPGDEEPVQKGKRVKRAAKKSSTTPATGIVVREPTVESKSKGKGKENVDVAHGKGIELLSDVSVTEEVQLKEVRKKTLRDFHMSHPGGSGTVTENPPSVEKITPTVTSEGTSNKPRVPDVTNDDSTKSESESWVNDKDDSNEEQELGNEGSEQENASDEQESDSKQDEENDDDDDD